MTNQEETKTVTKVPRRQTSRTGRKVVNVKMFVKIVETSDTTQDAAKRLGMSKTGVIGKINRLRKLGVNLKKLTSKTMKIDVKALNAYIKTLRK